MFVSDKLIVRDGGVYAIGMFKRDELILEGELNFVEYSTRTSVEINEGVFQDASDPEAVENFINHSCSPNAYIDFMVMRAKYDISVGNQITYNYLTADWKVNDSFDCHCGAHNCKGRIAGLYGTVIAQEWTLEGWVAK